MTPQPQTQHYRLDDLLLHERSARIPATHQIARMRSPTEVRGLAKARCSVAATDKQRLVDWLTPRKRVNSTRPRSMAAGSATLISLACPRNGVAV
jgi:hypothetical protein